MLPATYPRPSLRCGRTRYRRYISAGEQDHPAQRADERQRESVSLVNLDLSLRMLLMGATDPCFREGQETLLHIAEDARNGEVSQR